MNQKSADGGGAYYLVKSSVPSDPQLVNRKVLLHESDFSR